MNGHERIDELAGLRALGGLDPDDERALDALLFEHGPDCPDCRRIELEYAEMAGRMAFAIAPAAVREGLEDELVERARAERPPLSGRAPRSRATSGAEPVGPEQRAGDRAGVWRTIGAVAAALVLFAGGWLVGTRTTNGGLEAVQEARVVPFQGQQGELAIAYQPGERGILLLGAHLPVPEGRVYEVWMIQGKQRPVSGGCITPPRSGTLVHFVNADLGDTDTMAVTAEPSSCPSQPTTKPVFVASLS
jgi:anti-sigma-K factor RskA